MTAVEAWVLFLDLALLLGVEAGVLKHDHVARLHRGDFLVGIRAIRRECDRLAEHFREVFRDRLQAEIGLVTLFRRTAEVAHQNQAAAVVKHIADRRKCALDPGVVFDDPILDRHIEIDAHHNALSFEIDIAQSLLVHFLLHFKLWVQNKKGGRPCTTRPFRETRSLTWR